MDRDQDLEATNRVCILFKMYSILFEYSKLTVNNLFIMISFNHLIIIDIQLKLKALVTQVPQGQINPMPVMNNQNTPKYRSKTQGGNVKVL